MKIYEFIHHYGRVPKVRVLSEEQFLCLDLGIQKDLKWTQKALDRMKNTGKPYEEWDGSDIMVYWIAKNPMGIIELT